MHIAFFNRSYYPDQTATGQLLTDLCEDLVAEHGCRVSVVTGPPLHPLPGVPVPRRALLTRDTRHGVEVLRAGGTAFPKERFAGRATNYVTYFASATLAGLRLDRPDVVVALTDPPIIGLSAWLAGLRFRAPLVISFQDLFPEVAVLLQDFHSGTVNRALQAVNRFLVQRAARNVAIGETMRTRLIENKGAPPERTVVIPDWADTTAISPGPKDNAFAREHGLTDRFVVMHSGNLGLSQSLGTILDAAAQLRDLHDLTIVFQGEGVKKVDLQQRAVALGLDDVRFLPFAPADRLSEAFASADVFIVSLQRGLAGYIVPSKLYGILAAGRPYIAAVEDDCEVAAITTRHRCGLRAEPGDADGMARAIRHLHADPAATRAAGERARQAGLTFDRRVQVARYRELFEDVVLGRRADTAPAADAARDA